MQYQLKDLDKDGYYGIQIIGGNCIMKIAKDKDFIIYLIELLNQTDVEPCHIRDIVHDFLYEQYITI